MNLVRLYPAAWRARYGGELEDLLDGRRPTFRVVVDVVRGAVDAHVHLSWLEGQHHRSPTGCPASWP